MEGLNMKHNLEIRNAIKDSCFFTWQIADSLGVHENTFYRWMRTEMTDQKKAQVMSTIKKLKEKSTRGDD